MGNRMVMVTCLMTSCDLERPR